MSTEVTEDTPKCSCGNEATLVTYDNQDVCEFCAWTCVGCDDIGSDSDSNYVVDGEDLYCASCIDHCYYCDRCDEWSTECGNHISDIGADWCDGCASCYATWCDTCDQYTADGCDDCADNDENDYSGNRVIHDYSYRPDVVFHSTKSDDKLFFGFELEMELGDRREAAIFAANALEPDDIAYLKNDGSLDNGFELVTHPMSFEYLMNEDNSVELWDTIEKLRSNHGARSYNTSTCGFHIHISRTGFNGGAHMHKFLNLVYSNKALFTKLAGRSSDNWAKFDDVHQSRMVLSEDANGERNMRLVNLPRAFKDKITHGVSTDRYSAVNTRNSATLELRIFKGTMDKSALKAHLQLAHAAVEYTRTLSVADVRNGALEATAFLEYIFKQDIYDDLVARIERKQIVEANLPTSKPTNSTPASEIETLIQRSDEIERADRDRRIAEWEQAEQHRLEEMQRVLSMAYEREVANSSFTSEFISSDTTNNTYQTINVRFNR